MTNKTISVDEAKQIEFNILKYIDATLKENGIRYWLDAGTLLGCIRHKGFIPWDDDIDLVIMRKDYDRAIELLSQSLSDYFRLRDMFFPGSRKAIRWLQENDGEGFELYRKALLMRTNSSIEDWVRHSVAPVVQTLFKHLSET